MSREELSREKPVNKCFERKVHTMLNLRNKRRIVIMTMLLIVIISSIVIRQKTVSRKTMSTADVSNPYIIKEGINAFDILINIKGM